MEKRNVPTLRFPEFDSEWSESTLRQLSSKVSYGIGAAATDYDGKNKYLRITDIDEESRRFLPNPLTSPEGTGFDKYKLVQGDIVFARTGASVGKSYLYNPADGNLIYAGFLIKFHIDKADPRFVYLMTFRSEYDKWVQVYSMRSGQPGLNAEEYKNWDFSIPKLPEQQKIASFLSAVDKKIEQLTRKKELLEQYKKGVMQKLFPKPGEQHPELRFKQDDGSDFPDWEVKRLGDVFSIQMCKRIFADQTSEQGEVPFYKIGTIGAEADSFISKELFQEYRSKYNYPKVGETLITCSGTVGKCVRFDGNDSYFQDSNIVWIDNPNKEISNDYLYLLLSNYRWDKLNSTTITRIYTSDLKSIRFSFPTFKEQNQISRFIMSLNTKMEHCSRELFIAQTFKKGLLQQMFV